MQSSYMLLIVLILLVPMFLGFRRQKREADRVTRMQADLKVGDQVTTTSGLYGTVVQLDDTTVDLEVAEDVVTTWLRAAVRDVRTEDEPEVSDAAPAETVTHEKVAAEGVAAEPAAAQDSTDSPLTTD